MKVYKLMLACLCLVLLGSGCSMFQKGEVSAKNGRTHQRHCVGFGWNSDNYFYFGDPQSYTNADTEAGADFEKDANTNGNPP